MKKVIIILSLVLCLNSVLGQTILSKDVTSYLKNETKYNRKSLKIVESILKRTNVNFFIDGREFKNIPTFKAREEHSVNDLDQFVLSLKMDKSILWDEIIIFHQPNKDFKYYVGETFCKSNHCKLYLYDDSPARHERYERATEKFIFAGKYDLIFKVEGYPDFWFLWKDKQLSLFSFLDETLHTDKSELKSCLKNYAMKIER